MELSEPIIQSDYIPVESSAASESSRRIHERKERAHSSFLRDTNTSSLPARGGSQSFTYSQHDSDKASADVAATLEGYTRQTTWEQQQELAASDTPPTSTYNVSTDEFPFPDTQDKQLHDSNGADDREGLVGIEAGNISATVGGGLHNMDSSSPRSTDRSDAMIAASPVNGKSRLSRDGRNSNSSNHDRMNHLVSRRRGSGDSSSGGPVGGSSSPGWSSYAKRTSGVAGWHPTDGGESERYGADGHDQPVLGRAVRKTKGSQSASLSTSRPYHYHAHKQNMDINVDRAQLGESSVSRRESWTHGRAGNKAGQGGAQGSYGANNGAFAKQRQGGTGAADPGQQPQSGATGQSGWEDGGGDREGTRLETVGQRQASERMVDEDAYRFRSFSEEVWCTCHSK